MIGLIKFDRLKFYTRFSFSPNKFITVIISSHWLKIFFGMWIGKFWHKNINLGKIFVLIIMAKSQKVAFAVGDCSLLLPTKCLFPWSHCDVTHWFLKSDFEAQIGRHLGVGILAVPDSNELPKWAKRWSWGGPNAVCCWNKPFSG